MTSIVVILFFGIFALDLLQPSYSNSTSSEDPDSSEHGVKPGNRINNCTCGEANKGDTWIYSQEYPLMVGLVDRKLNRVYCGATIITNKHIITAAHCLKNRNPSDIGVFGGSYHYQNDLQVRVLEEPERFILHNEYDERHFKSDIAVIYMKKSMTYYVDVGPVCLPTVKLQLTGELLKILGWGQTEKVNSSDVLMKVNVFGISLEDCRKHFPSVDEQQQNCMFRGEKGACNGDDGGPVLWRDPDTNRYTLVGVMSQTAGCGNTPTVNTDVQHFLPWIQQVISETDPSMQTCAKI